MDVATLLASARRRAGLSQRELAKRARTSAAAICLYEQGDRVPRVDTLELLVAAAGSSLSLQARPAPAIDVRERGADLVAVLGLADRLPRRHAATLEYPPFHAQVGR